MNRSISWVIVITLIIALCPLSYFVYQRIHSEKLVEATRENATRGLQEYLEILLAMHPLKVHEGSLAKRIGRIRTSIEVLNDRLETQTPLLCRATCVYNSGTKGQSWTLCLGWVEKDDNVRNLTFRVKTQHAQTIEAWSVVKKSGWTGVDGVPYKVRYVQCRKSDTMYNFDGQCLEEPIGLPLIYVKLTDADGNESNWVPILIIPEKAVVFAQLLDNRREDVYWKKSGAIAKVCTEYALDIDPGLLTEDESNTVRFLIDLWVRHRTVQWLDGTEVPNCYRFRLLESQGPREVRPQSKPSRWVPSFTGTQGMSQDEDAPGFYYDARRLNLFSRHKYPIMMFSTDPLYNTKHLRRISFSDYIRTLSNHPDFKPYISAIQIAERSGIVLRAADPR